MGKKPQSPRVVILSPFPFTGLSFSSPGTSTTPTTSLRSSSSCRRKEEAVAHRYSLKVGRREPSSDDRCRRDFLLILKSTLCLASPFRGEAVTAHSCLGHHLSSVFQTKDTCFKHQRLLWTVLGRGGETWPLVAQASLQFLSPPKRRTHRCANVPSLLCPLCSAPHGAYAGAVQPSRGRAGPWLPQHTVARTGLSHWECFVLTLWSLFGELIAETEAPHSSVLWGGVYSEVFSVSRLQGKGSPPTFRLSS